MSDSSDLHAAQARRIARGNMALFHYMCGLPEDYPDAASDEARQTAAVDLIADILHAVYGEDLDAMDAAATTAVDHCTYEVDELVALRDQAAIEALRG